MSPEQKELFRLAVLRVLEANNTRFGLGVAAIGLHLGTFGFPAPNESEVQEAVEYLEGKGLVHEILKLVSRENRAWRITQKGLGFLDERS